MKLNPAAFWLWRFLFILSSQWDKVNRLEIIVLLSGPAVHFTIHPTTTVGAG